MNRQDLVIKIAEEAGVTKKAAGLALNAVIDGITLALEKGDKAKTAVLTFKRTGGIAGFHDNLTIYNDMTYAVQAPPHRPTKKTRTGKLDDGQKESLAKLLKTFGKVEWSRGNAPGVADGMQEAITINGSGKKTKLDPGAPEFRQILELVTGILRPRPAR
jgi:hypothetical protein